MKNIAITGVSGYIGSRLLSRLDDIPGINKVIGIDMKPPTKRSGKLHFYCQDILQPLGDIFLENEVDSAIHLAFVLKPTHNRNGARQVDIGGISNFLDACRQAQVRHILYLSSHTVYGAYPDNPVPLREDAPLRPITSFQYSWDKGEAERILTNFAASHKDVCLTILRSCPVIGPNAGNSVVTSMFKPIMIRVAGFDPPLQFVHEDDLVKLVVTMLRQKKAGIFNVAGDGEVPYTELARLCGKRTVTLPDKLLRLLMSFSWALHLQSQSPPSGLEFIKYPPVLSTEKLKRETGFQFGYSSKQAVISFLSATAKRRKKQRTS
ncbi:MAG: SDR family oxidoreductase [Dehalococcoidales bacterium]